MLDLQRAFESFSPEIEVNMPSVDTDFITRFLQPYFRHMTHEQLAAQLAAIMAGESERQGQALRGGRQPDLSQHP